MSIEVQVKYFRNLVGWLHGTPYAGVIFVNPRKKASSAGIFNMCYRVCTLFWQEWIGAQKVFVNMMGLLILNWVLSSWVNLIAVNPFYIFVNVVVPFWCFCILSLSLRRLSSFPLHTQYTTSSVLWVLWTDIDGLCFCDCDALHVCYCL